MSIEFPERFNMADYFLYHNLEEGRENKTCLYFNDQTFTFGEAARMSNRIGNALRMLGVRMEDRLLMVLPDCPEFVWAWFGAARIGAVITMVNPLLPAEDYRYYLKYTRARAAIVHESFLKPFAEAAANAEYLRSVLVVQNEEALDALEKDHEFLLRGDVFTKDVISTWLEYKRERELNAVRLRPVPYEFYLYYDI